MSVRQRQVSRNVVDVKIRELHVERTGSMEKNRHDIGVIPENRERFINGIVTSSMYDRRVITCYMSSKYEIPNILVINAFPFL
jgi:hypothetical protein